MFTIDDGTQQRSRRQDAFHQKLCAAFPYGLYGLHGRLLV